MTASSDTDPDPAPVAAPESADAPAPTAALLLIGDELLSGRTRDINLQQLAGVLGPLGIPVREARIVADEADAISEAVNALRAAHTYLFTTGGIGPTHDDITTDAVGAAFGVAVRERADIAADLERRYAAAGEPFTGARRRMARLPDGAVPVANPVSGAPGFQLENVFVLAGVPRIMRAMLEDVAPRLVGGARVHRREVRGRGLREGAIADALGEMAAARPELVFGSYPWFAGREDYGVGLLVSGRDEDAVESAAAELEALARERGGEIDMEAPAKA